MKNKRMFGTILSIVGLLNGLLLFYLLASIYMLNINGKIIDGRPDEAVAVQITFAMLGWLGISAGALWGAVLYGFLTKQRWAWYWGTLAASVQMLAGFFPMIPPSSIGLPAPTIWVFLIGTALWFGTLYIGKVDRRIVALTFVAGLAFVLTYMDGVANISKFQTTTYNDFWKGMYAMAQMVLWGGAAAWLTFIVATLRHKSWAVPLGIFAGLMSMIGGYPLAIVNIIEVKRFSMFLPAPVIAMGLLIALCFPATQRLIIGWGEKEPSEELVARL